MNPKKVFLVVPILELMGVAGTMGLYFLFPHTLFTLAQKTERQIAGLEQKPILVEGLAIVTNIQRL